MEKIFYLGDMILKKGSLEVTSIFFIGSELLGSGKWKVNLSLTYTNGYAGHGTNMYLIASRGDRFRFGQGFKGFDMKQGLLGGEKKALTKEVQYIQFDDIEADSITISYID